MNDCIFVGGVVRSIVEKSKCRSEEEKTEKINIGGKFNLGQIESLLVLAAIIFYLFKNTVLSKTEEKETAVETE